MPRFSMPESATAMRAAATDPAPARSVYRLDMSDSTPILMTLSEICACAAPFASVAATATASRFCFDSFMVAPPVDRLIGGRLHAQVLVQLAHAGVELGVRDQVHDAAVLHHVVPVRHGRGEAEVLLDQQDREPLGLEPRDR